MDENYTDRCEDPGAPGCAQGVWQTEIAVPETGATLTAGGVTIEIPEGALASGTTLMLTVALDAGLPTITVTPHTVFAEPVRVSLDASVPDFGTDAVVYFVDQDGALELTDVLIDGDRYFYTDHFSTLRFGNLTNPALLPDVWMPNARAVWFKGAMTTEPTCVNCDVCWTAAGGGAPNCAEPTLCQELRGSLTNVSDAVAGWDKLSPLNSSCGGSREAKEAYSLEREVGQALGRVQPYLKADPFLPAAAGWRVWLNGAWSSAGSGHHEGSKHYSGRAADLGLCVVDAASGDCNKNRVGPNGTSVRVAPLDGPELGRLAALTFSAFLEHARAMATAEVRVHVWYEPNSQLGKQADHVHADLTYHCPDVRSVWDSGRKRCRRPKVTLTRAGAAAPGGRILDVGNYPAIDCGASCAAEGTEIDAGGPDLALLASQLDQSGVEAVNWGGDCAPGSGKFDLVGELRVFHQPRTDIGCSVQFECPGQTTWDGQRCVRPSCPIATPVWNGTSCVPADFRVSCRHEPGGVGVGGTNYLLFEGSIAANQCSTGVVPACSAGTFEDGTPIDCSDSCMYGAINVSWNAERRSGTSYVLEDMHGWGACGSSGPWSLLASTQDDYISGWADPWTPTWTLNDPVIRLQANVSIRDCYTAQSSWVDCQLQ